MSTGKRLAKRSILGTRIVAPGQDGRFYPAVIQSVRPGDPVLAANNPRYTVRFDNSRKVIELPESELIGPGFSNINTSTQLMPGQRVYLTHGGREMEATILSHDNIRDEAIVNIGTVGVISILQSAANNFVHVKYFLPGYQGDLCPMMASSHQHYQHQSCVCVWDDECNKTNLETLKTILSRPLTEITTTPAETWSFLILILHFLFITVQSINSVLVANLQITSGHVAFK